MSSTTGRARAATALTLSLSVTGGTLVLNLLTGVLLARILGPDGRGELTAILLWPSLLVTVGSLGVSDALTYYAARGADPNELIGDGATLALVQALVLLAVGLVIEPLVLHHYHHDATVSAYIMLVGFVPASLLGLNLLGIVNGRQRLVSYQLLRGLVFVLTAIALVAVAVSGHLTVRAAVYCYVAANVATVLVIAVEIWRRDRPRPRVTPHTMKALTVFGAKSQTSNVSVVLNGNLDQLLVSVFLAPRALGLYTIACTVGYTVSVIGYSVAPVALPLVASAKDPATQRERARALVSVTVAVSVLVAAPLIVFAPDLIVLVFGRRFHDAATAARILLASSIVFSVNRSLEAVLKAVGRPLDAGIAEAVGLVVTAASLAVLIQFHSLPAVACASMLAALTSGALLISRAHRALGLSLGDLVPTRDDVLQALRLVRHPSYTDDGL